MHIICGYCARTGHKTSRFYGPTIHTHPSGIGQWVSVFEASLVFEMTGANPFLFPLTTDWERGHSSSGWTSLVKSVFKRHAGVACPPKLLRASFCTHLRSADGVDSELLESCAKAMKHQVATGGSDNYGAPRSFATRLPHATGASWSSRQLFTSSRLRACRQGSP